MSVCLKKCLTSPLVFCDALNIIGVLLVIGKNVLRVTIDEMQKFSLANVAMNGYSYSVYLAVAIKLWKESMNDLLLDYLCTRHK